jgi:hypothetical protein
VGEHRERPAVHPIDAIEKEDEGIIARCSLKGL